MRAKVASHVSPLKYLSLPSSDIQKRLQLKYTWDTLVGHRDILLLWCDYIQLGMLIFDLLRLLFVGASFAESDMAIYIYMHMFSATALLSVLKELWFPLQT